MKNKIIILSIILLLFSFIFINNSVFAETKTNSLIVDDYDFSDIYNYFSTDEAFFIYQLSDGNIFFYKPYSDFDSYKVHLIREDDSSTARIFYTDDSFDYARHCSFYIFDTSTQKFNLSWSGDMVISHNISNMTILYSSQGIYNSDKTTFFFKAPVTVVPETEIQGTLAPILERVEMMEPIVTTISGTLKLLIPFLVSLIAFWKAWQVFSRVLHHA